MICEPSLKQIEAIQESNARINIFDGPVRAGKSFSALIRWLEFCRNGPKGLLILCGRTDKTIKRNIIMPMQELLGNRVTYQIGKGEVKLFNRTMIVVGANDDRAEAKIRGSTFAGALVDEAALLPESFFKMLLSRLSVEGAKLFCSTNPDSPYHWLKRDFMDREHELDLKVFKFNIRDNPSLSEKYIEDLSREYQGMWYKRYIEGEWCLADGAVYDFFDEDIHVIDMPRTEADYYIVGVDYGTTNPCVFTLIGYNPGGYPNIWLEKEYHYDSQKELRQKSDYEYAKDFIDFIAGHNVKRIYIDPSAASFKQELRRQGVFNVMDAQNDVIPGIRFHSMLLSNGTFKICSQCVNTIKEYKNYLWDSKASQRGEDKPIKANDHCFAAGSLVSTERGQIPIEEIKEGEMVLTPIGYRKVLKTFVHEDDVYEFNILGQRIECTKDHKFFTVNGWKKASDMIQSDMFLINIVTECQKKSSYLTASNTDGMYPPRIYPIEHIIEHIKQIVLKDTDISIEMFGNSIMEKFPKECMSITMTKIPTTMTLAISSLSQLVSIYPIMGQILLKNRKKIEEYVAKKLDLSQKNGIDLKKDMNGTKRMSKIHCHGKGELNIPNTASNVQKNLQEIQKDKTFVRISVNLNGEETISLMMKLEYVNHVMQNLEQINTAKTSVVPCHVPENYIGKQKVYNLHVEDFHVYFVSYLATVNCMDSLRYSLYTHFFNKNIRETFTEEDALKLEEYYR